MTPPTTNPSDSTTTTNTTTLAEHGWTRPNYKGIYFHDNRRLLAHREKNCVCPTCIRELKKLPPMETHEEYVASIKVKSEAQEIKRAKKNAKKEVKGGKQSTIKTFFKPPKPSRTGPSK